MIEAEVGAQGYRIAIDGQQTAAVQAADETNPGLIGDQTVGRRIERDGDVLERVDLQGDAVWRAVEFAVVDDQLGDVEADLVGIERRIGNTRVG